MSSQESSAQQPSSADSSGPQDETLLLHWQSHSLPIMAIDEQYFVVESEVLAAELPDAGDSPLQAGAISYSAGDSDASDSQRILVRFVVDETHNQLVRCRFGPLDQDTQDDLAALRQTMFADSHGTENDDEQTTAPSHHSEPGQSAPRQTATPVPTSQRPPRRRGRSVILGGAVFAGCLVVFSSAKPEPKIVTFQSAELATQTVPVESSADGMVSEMLVEIGGKVQVGDPIARLKAKSDNSKSESLTQKINDGNRRLIVLEQQRNELETAIAVARKKAELDRKSVQAELAKARAIVMEEKAKLRRLAPLILDGNIGDAEVDQIKAVVAKASAEVDKQQVELDRLTLITQAANQDILVTPEGVKPMTKLNSEITQLTAEVQRLTVQRSRTKFVPVETEIVSTESGVVQALHLDAGSPVRFGEKALTLTKVDPKWALGMVDATSAADLQIGQTVSVELSRDEIHVQGTIKAIGESQPGEAVPVRVSVDAIDGVIAEDELAADTPMKISLPIDQPSRLNRWINDLRSSPEKPEQ